jgi:hypothetical protein
VQAPPNVAQCSLMPCQAVSDGPRAAQRHDVLCRLAPDPAEPQPLPARPKLHPAPARPTPGLTPLAAPTQPAAPSATSSPWSGVSGGQRGGGAGATRPASASTHRTSRQHDPSPAATRTHPCCPCPCHALLRRPVPTSGNPVDGFLDFMVRATHTSPALAALLFVHSMCVRAHQQSTPTRMAQRARR